MTAAERLARDIEIVRLHRQGMGCRPIAAQLGVSKSVVSNVIRAWEEEHQADIDTEPAEPLDDEHARSLDARLRSQARVFDHSWDQLRLLVTAAQRGQIHATLGFKSWPDYVADIVQKEMPNLARSVDQRRQMVELLAGEEGDEGMSDRAIAAAIGVSKTTVNRDQDAIEAKQVAHNVPPEPTGDTGDSVDSPGGNVVPITAKRKTGLDGKRYRKPKPTPNSVDDPAAQDAQPTDTTDDDDGLLMKAWELSAASNMGALDARLRVTFLGRGDVDPAPVDIPLGNRQIRLPARIEPNVAEDLAINLRLALPGIEALIALLDRRARKGMA